MLHYYVEGEGAVEGSQKKKKARGDDAAETEEDVEEKVEAAAAEEEDLLKPPEPRNMECFVKTVVEEYRWIKEQPFRFFLKYEAVPRYIGELEADVELQRGVFDIFERIDEERTFASAIRSVIHLLAEGARCDEFTRDMVPSLEIMPGALYVFSQLECDADEIERANEADKGRRSEEWQRVEAFALVFEAALLVKKSAKLGGELEAFVNEAVSDQGVFERHLRHLGVDENDDDPLQGDLHYTLLPRFWRGKVDDWKGRRLERYGDDEPGDEEPGNEAK